MYPTYMSKLASLAKKLWLSKPPIGNITDFFQYSLKPHTFPKLSINSWAYWKIGFLILKNTMYHLRFAKFLGFWCCLEEWCKITLWKNTPKYTRYKTAPVINNDCLTILYRFRKKQLTFDKKNSCGETLCILIYVFKFYRKRGNT